MFNSGESLSPKINQLCERLTKLKLSSSDDLGSNCNRKSPLKDKRLDNVDENAYSMVEVFAKIDQLSSEMREMKTTQTTILLLMCKLTDQMAKLEANFNKETIVTPPTSVAEPKKRPVRRQSKQHQPPKSPHETQESHHEKENLPESTVKKEKVVTRRRSSRNALLDLSTKDKMNSPDSNDSCSIVYDRNASLSTSVTLRPLRRRADYREYF